ncbi:hypothetical protein LOTGIDRAFT_164904 [Lottia gigantea]|uniref:Uncharacterized protein n=1 Tax=Lottia gigantea TaxID=225164 RepID=V4A3P7_LOTGI|nr:hypothetical protein LOTGIDRAFT_164904 [Lottia gigantea]ESO89605.1 hypothetical protein LOTGIDRAFT_164904 [Lottia gigantea]
MSIAGKDFSDTQSNRLVLEHDNTTLNPLVDLHVYIVPPDIWRDRFNNLLNQSVSETVSIGIIRVSPDIKLTDIRDELPRQLEDLVPSDFIFLRSVGRSLTRVRL